MTAGHQITADFAANTVGVFPLECDIQVWILLSSFETLVGGRERASGEWTVVDLAFFTQNARGGGQAVWRQS